MQKQCVQCGSGFEVAPEDLDFLDRVSPVIGGKKYSIPPSTRCPDCRMQRRLLFRNQTTLYKRTCDATKKPIVSIYSQEKPHTVYSPEAWWADSWDAINFGRDLDVGSPFFPQFRALMEKVPHIAVLVVNSENSEYTNQTYNCRRCYLSSAIKDAEDCLYCHHGNELKDSTDCSFCFNSELLFQCRDTYGSYHCAFASNSIQCTDCYFVDDCLGCTDCFCCVGLRKKQYCVFNEQLKKDEYQKRIGEFQLSTESGIRKAKEQFAAFLETKPHIYAWVRNSENTTGNNINSSKNARFCFDSNDLEDCAYSTWIFASKDCQDCYGMGASELVYDSVGVEEVQRTAFSFGTSNSSECYYTDLCFNCTNCFGCSALMKKKYCILNKQYSKEEYEALVPKLIAAMEKNREWGEFFDPSVSAFAYNETKAQEHYPLTKTEALQQGLRWKDDIDQIPTVSKVIPGNQLPDTLADIPDDILNWAITCERTERPFVIPKQELAFYRRWNYAVPRVHPNERQRERMQQRNPQRLWKRTCAKCGKEVQTPYAPDRSETIYCEACYLKEMY